VLPPVATCGRPLRDLEDSPDLGSSQLSVGRVVEKVRDWWEEVAVVVEEETRARRAEWRPRGG